MPENVSVRKRAAPDFCRFHNPLNRTA